jgi:tellurite resistance protein TerC
VVWLWLGFFAFVGVLLLLHRKMSARTIRSAAYWTAAWFVIGISFAGLVYPVYEHAWLGATLDEPSDSPGADATAMFMSAYVLEYALAIDTIVVAFVLCRTHRVPRRHEPRVLFWGLVGAILVRPLILLCFTSLARAFTWISYVLGAAVASSSLIVLKGAGDDDDMYHPSKGLAQVLWRRKRLAHREYATFRATQDGRWMLTMAAACALSLVYIDSMFALDSAAAALSISTTTFIVVTSNILATIAVRSWFFGLSVIQSLELSTKSAAVLLGVVGLKMVAHDLVRVPPSIWLAVIGGIVGLGAVEAVMATRRAAR